MSETYSTYEAKAKLSEILRKVESGATVRISRRGEEIAEIRPIRTGKAGLEKRIGELSKRGAVTIAAAARGSLEPVARRPGALRRFLADRE